MWSRKNVNCLSKDLPILINKFCLSKTCSFQWSRTTNGSKGKDWDMQCLKLGLSVSQAAVGQHGEIQYPKCSAVKWDHSNYAKRSCVFKQMNATPPWRNCFLIIFSLVEDPSSTICFYFHWKRELSFKKIRVEIKTTF